MSKPKILKTDASGVAIAGVLSQGEIGNDKPIAFISRTLNEAEQRSTIEREMLAIFWSIKQLRPYLYAQEFIVRCDHKPIQFIFKMKDIHSRIYRWTYYLSHFSFVVIYCPGEDNVVADALSRSIGNQDVGNSQVNSLPMSDCNVITRSMKNKENQFYTNNDKNDENIYNEKCYDDMRLKNKTLENSNSYISESQDFNCEMIERHINMKMNERYHEFKLLTQQEFDNMDEIFRQINENIYYTVAKEIYEFYLIILHEITYDNIYNTMYDLMIFLKEKNINELCYIKRDDLRVLNFIKMKQIIRYVLHDTNIKMYIFVNDIIHITYKDEINKIIFEYHNSLIGGHLEINRTLREIKKIYHWKSINNDIKNHVEKCDLCLRNKINKRTKNAFTNFNDVSRDI